MSNEFRVEDASVDARIADLEYQNELLRVEQDWQAERERHRTGLGKDPSRLHCYLGMIGGLWLVGFGACSILFPGALLVGLPLAIFGVAIPAYQFRKLRRFEAARDRYRRRRTALIERRADVVGPAVDPAFAGARAAGEPPKAGRRGPRSSPLDARLTLRELGLWLAGLAVASGAVWWWRRH